MTKEQQDKLPTKDDVKKTPKDEVIEAEIVDTKITTWREYFDGNMEKLDKFDNPDQKIVAIKYQTPFTTSEDAIPYYDAPSDKSILGRFLEKYGNLNKGTKFKVYFNNEGYPELKKLLT